MTWSIKNKLRSLLAAETDLRPQPLRRGGQLRVCLISPSRYHTGMSSLGFQTVLALFTAAPGVVCERAFLPDREDMEEHRRSGTPLLSLESQLPLDDFDVVAFSTSFEPDYPNIPLLLALGRIPIWARERTASDPLVIAGGAAFMINPEPVADFLDLVCLGDGEELIPELLSLLLSTQERQDMLRQLATRPGFYVPSLYQPLYQNNHFAGFEPAPGLPISVGRICSDPASHTPACSVILTENTEFGDMFLVEVSRGCPRGCRFCSSGFVYGSFRQQPYEHLTATIARGLGQRSKVGLVGAAVSDHRDIGRLCRFVVDQGAKVSVSSLRLDRLNDDLVEALVASGHKTISLAPEGGSQRLRDLVRKNLTEEQILEACEMLIARGILNLKLYVIIGLPTEQHADLEELLRLVLAIRERVLQRARGLGRLGEITLSVNPFIPKPFTPFQWCGMEPLASLERKVKWLESKLRPVANVHLKVESLKGSYLQALLSRGDRRCGLLLARLAEGNSLKKAAKLCGIDTDRLVQANLPLEAPLPWSLLGSADQQHLADEYTRAFSEGLA